MQVGKQIDDNIIVDRDAGGIDGEDTIRTKRRLQNHEEVVQSSPNPVSDV